jgi:serine/threonine-protein kinase
VGVVLSGRYLVERLIGEGGMGAVYQAEHTHMRKRLAVKVLHPEMSRLSEVVARFEREAMAAAHIEHPNVAAATDFGKLEDGSFFLVLEYVEGQSLRDAMAKGRMALGRALHIARQIASALGRAHALGIVHRDLKPENVMLVVREGDTDFVKILDFGIAKVPVGELAPESKSSGQILTQLGMVYGTPEYMAPEQALGQAVDARADLYALGVILFEMVTGARPYSHESKVTLLGMHVAAPIPKMTDRAPDAEIPAELDAIVTRLLAKEASARFSDAKELMDALDACAADLARAGQIGEAELTRPSVRSQSASAAAHNAPDREPTVATAPGATKLAEPIARATRALAALSSGSLARVSQGLSLLSKHVARRRLIFAASVGALLLVAIAAVRATQERPVSVSHTEGPEPAPEPAAPPTRKVDPRLEEAVATATANIEKGDFATAIGELTSVEKWRPDRADIHVLLERAYTGVREVHEALREAQLALAADPSVGGDLKLEEDVRNAALLRDTQEEAFALLESNMGSRGVDILYDIAFGGSGRLYPQAAARAKRSLTVDDVRARASPALGIVLELRDAKNCETKHGLLERAREVGDVRALALLQQYQQTRGCGFLGVADCYPCLRRDELLSETAAAIEERTAHAP